jgi:hypothetical protein
MNNRGELKIIYLYVLKSGNRRKRAIGSLNRNLRLKEIPGNRADFVKCRFYDDCLDYAAQKNMESFTCRECPYFKNNKYEDGNEDQRMRTEL